ncbi:MAG: FecR domain-containing protein [Flavobacteriales bacterium]|nr:FecR domain-containing protein [Flavobacteriales bacterium]
MNTPENKHPDHDLLAKYLAGETTIPESEKIEEWIGESDENWEEFQQLSKVWEKTNPDEQSEFDSKKAWNKLDSRLVSEEKPSVFRKYPLMIAAALIGLVAISLVYKSFLTGDYVEQIVLETTTETKELTLADGSIVHLNTGSSIEYPSIFRGDERAVALSGEAFFEIEKNASKPFVINANGSVVKVLGTSFNVKTEESKVVVSVETGKVEFRSSEDIAQKKILAAGENAVYDIKVKKLIELDPMEADYLFWKDRTLNYRSVPLSEVVRQLNKNYQVSITLSDTQLNGCLLSSRFEDMEIEQILNVLASTFNLEIEKADDQTLLIGEGCD